MYIKLTVGLLNLPHMFQVQTVILLEYYKGLEMRNKGNFITAQCIITIIIVPFSALVDCVLYTHSVFIFHAVPLNIIRHLLLLS